VVAKRLFGVRGGKKAYEAMLRSESILQKEVNALEAERSAAVTAGPPTTTPATDGLAAQDTPVAPNPTPTTDGVPESTPSRDTPAAPDGTSAGRLGRGD